MATMEKISSKLRIGIFYGARGGNTQRAAKKIADALQSFKVTLDEIVKFSEYEIEAFDLLIFGSATWGQGELDDGWKQFLPDLDKFCFDNKKIALFGMGDQVKYPETFVDSMGILKKIFAEKGAELIGFCPVENYHFKRSAAKEGDLLVGLALDEDTEPDLTSNRINQWVFELKKEVLDK